MSLALGALAGALALVALARPAGAHEISFELGGDAISICGEAGSCASGSFRFEAAGPEVFLIDHDPRTDGAQVLVRGLGASGGRTEVISLDRGLWSVVAGAFQYTDPTGSRGGITSVTLASGQLVIEAAGAGFPWSPAGPQDVVWVHFRLGDVWYCAEFPGAGASLNEAARFEAVDADAPLECPSTLCGNGIPEAGEQCDDGNLVSGDGCEDTCELGDCNAAAYASTFEAIQEVVFEGGYGCTNALCHDAQAPKNDLDLTAPAAYEALLGANGLGAPSVDSTLKRVEPAEPDLSFLYLKLAAATYPALAIPGVGTPMPSGGAPALSEEHLEAVRRWIRNGAPQTGVVEGTSELLGTCLPPPTPQKIPVPAPPPPGAGFQLQQTPWPLLGANPPVSQGEDEVCMATFFDLTGTAIVPEWARGPCTEGFEPRRACSNDANRACTTDAECGTGNTCRLVKNTNNPTNECFRYHAQVLHQDPQSHHSIIHLYTGQADTTDPGWGPWTYKFDDPDDPRNGQPCDPTDVDPDLGYHPGCSGSVQSSLACVGYGPADASNFGNIAGGGGGNLPQFSGSQEPYYELELADGVFSTLPMRGIVVWNSHAFNLTQTDSTMSQYLNLDFAAPADQEFPVQGIFDAGFIFNQEVPAFGTQELCATHTLPKGARLFQLSSHTHLRGVRWRTWAPPNTPCQPGCPPDRGCFGTFCRCNVVPNVPLCADLDYPPDDRQPLYFSTEYNDPLQLDIDPPMELDGDDAADRTLLFCSLFDNGSTPASPPVKQRSTSPTPPPLEIGGFFASGELIESLGILGGKCAVNQLRCLDGPNQGLTCGTGGTPDHAFCDTVPGAGDGMCDACPARGGVTTEDEMFILLGNYFVPEPDALSLGLAAAAALAGLVSRRGARCSSARNEAQDGRHAQTREIDSAAR